MPIVLFILLMLPLACLAWWLWADRRLRGVPRNQGALRIALAVFMMTILLTYAWMIAARRGFIVGDPPTPLLTGMYLWMLIVLPASLLMAGGHQLLHAARAFQRLLRLSAPDRVPETLVAAPATPAEAPLPPATEAPETPALTRREVLRAAAALAPPLILTGTTSVALAQVRSFETRTMDVVLPDLPRGLDGLTITHVTDVHVGKFTEGPVLRHIAEQVNRLKSDMVVVTGDLIDSRLSDLPAALDTIRQFEAGHGTFLCEGNHDLFESREIFESHVRASGVRMLINEAAEIEVNGVPVEMLGLRWGFPGGGRGAYIPEQMELLAAQRQPGRFPILLAHHPHAFDHAERAGIPLTLAGHTHGGQLNLTRGIGAGPWMFRYWSGLYAKRNARLFVSNGVGNWFPLRVNAPAELVQLRLRRA